MPFSLKPIPHNRPTLGIEEERMAVKVIQSGWLAQGSEVEKLENEFCDFLGLQRGSAVAVSSGTAALYLGLLSLQAKGKNVSVPVYSCSALRNAIAMVGGNQLLVDSKPDSPNMATSKVNLSTDIAIIPHMFGIPQEISKSMYNFRVIEDCAQSLGAYINQIPVGLQGDIGIFSFFATKLMTTGGQGGMVVSKDLALIQFIRDYRTFDQRDDGKYRFNFQMTDLQAAIGRVQLSRYPLFLKRRAEIYARYKKAGLPLLDSSEGIQSVRFRAIIRTIKPIEVIQALKNENISVVIPVKDWELLGPKELYEHAYYWTQNTVSLPIYPTLTDEEVIRIIKAVTDVL